MANPQVIQGRVGTNYKGGQLIKDNAGTLEYYVITDVYHLPTGNTELHLDSNASLVASDEVWLAPPTAVVFDENNVNGRKVILYSYDTGNSQFEPIFPDIINANEVVFTGINLPAFDASDPDNNIAGYYVVSDKDSSLSGTAVDPSTGSVVNSNTLSLTFSLPLRLQPIAPDVASNIPGGFTIATTNTTQGSGLGGANYITINPFADGVNQLPLIHRG